MTMRKTVTAMAGLLALATAAQAQQVLDPRDPAAMAAWIRADDQRCPRAAAVRREGQTNRGALWRVECYQPDGAGQWWYQMILSPDHSHVALYPCGAAGRCPVVLE